MPSLKKKTTFPGVRAGAGVYVIPAAQDLAGDERLSVQLSEVEVPDFESIAKSQFEKASACPGFFPSGINQLTRKIIAELGRYTHEVDEASTRLKYELDTTHKASLDAALVACRERLAEIGCDVDEVKTALDACPERPVDPGQVPVTD